MHPPTIELLPVPSAWRPATIFRRVRRLLRAAVRSARHLAHPRSYEPDADSNQEYLEILGRAAAQKTSDAYPEELICNLMSTLIEMKQNQLSAPQWSMPARDWSATLENSWGPTYQMAKDNDSASFGGFLDFFFRNEGLTGFWGGSRMYRGFREADYFQCRELAAQMASHLRTLQHNYPGITAGDLTCPDVGSPWGWLVRGSDGTASLVPQPFPEYYHHARVISNLVSGSSRPIVVEIGGGFGGLAYMLKRHAPHIRYIGFDLPENALLQHYYLQRALPEQRHIICPRTDADLMGDLFDEEWDTLIAPNYLIPEIPDQAVDISVNFRSLSEMNSDTISEYLNHISRFTREFFFHENLVTERTDGLHGIPANLYPELKDFRLLMRSRSRWARYSESTGYVCDEFLLGRHK